jgi:voltage-gated potassium channel
VKFLPSQIAFLVRDPHSRKNLDVLWKYFVFLFAVILIYSIAFHFIMAWFEGEEHSWMTGFYWTLTVMSTLGFGDITFHSDVGRLFSIVVLMSGIFLLLIVLPFVFIRSFYAPWLEARIRTRIPRVLADDVNDHVVICRHDSTTPGLIRQLVLHQIPYVVILDDPDDAIRMKEEGLSVIYGEIDSAITYENVRVSSARLIVANAEDTSNTNIVLTVRAIDPDVRIVALAEEEDSVDILELSGASRALPLKMLLGNHLAARVSVGVGRPHEVGRFRDLRMVEFLVHHTDLAGKTLIETRLREKTGISVIGVWSGGKLKPVGPHFQLTEDCVPVAIGSQDQIEKLSTLLDSNPQENHEVLVIGGGKVGRSTALALRERGVRVRMLDDHENLRPELEQECDTVEIGNAADRNTIIRAGIDRVQAVALTTNDDGVNIHLTVYCRRLNPELSIVSRISKERNIEAMHRAGADYILSYSTLFREYVMAYLMKREPMLVGEGASFFSVEMPKSIVGKTLAEAGIGARTGLIVLAMEEGEEMKTRFDATTVLSKDARLLMLGTDEQRNSFDKEFR